uniref:Uncharacterized protein n=1 Tax=Acrobeloides nanus TaxID=290746 RepID=A0A914DP28_9BILA
ETPETIPRNFGPRFRRDAESTLPSDKAVVVDAQLNSTPIPTTTSSGEELPEGSGQELLSHNELALPKEQAKRSSNEVEGSGQNLPPDASGEEVN